MGVSQIFLLPSNVVGVGQVVWPVLFGGCFYG
uniref:Uncharacterized protein n=1 Tax=Siphoviridae sp. ct6YY1 TaxID=2825343 RepID=A0A8S5V2X4_9CAUD|nr:MAG TPA: hypothetical protein [Siphoviridae sp. ct6YY1]